MSQSTPEAPNAIIGDGRAVHALRKGIPDDRSLTYRDVRCGAGNSLQGGIYRQSRKIRRTDYAVTCKNCIRLAESDTIWAGGTRKSLHNDHLSATNAAPTYEFAAIAGRLGVHVATATFTCREQAEGYAKDVIRLGLADSAGIWHGTKQLAVFGRGL